MMKYVLVSMICSIVVGVAGAQERKRAYPVKKQFRDTMFIYEKDNAGGDELSAVLLNENDRSSGNEQYIPSILSSDRDPFSGIAAFHFGNSRFRMRGYDAAYFRTTLNGLPMNLLDDGGTPWSLWNGLNDVMRNTTSQFLKPNEFSFGNVGNTVAIQATPGQFANQTKMSYSLSNRAYTHRWMMTWHTGKLKNGWAFSFSGSRRYADESAIPATFYDGWSYFAGIEKQLNPRQSLSLVVFGAPLKNGKQSAVVNELSMLLGKKYNPNWGYQGDQKRNANTGKTHMPVAILRHESRINNLTTFNLILGSIAGSRSITGLEWYKAADPRPDYYRYLPGFQQDSVLKAATAEAYRTDQSVSQLDWGKMYDVNRNSRESVLNANGRDGYTISGLRSHYIQEERICRLNALNMAAILHTNLTGNITLTTGVQLMQQNNRYYKEAKDLLGGDFYVNHNQFAERDFPNDPDALQHDLDHPNRLIYKGDKFGYDYGYKMRYANAWLQTVWMRKKTDFFLALDYSYSQVQRVGYVRNGLFPGNSLGESEMLHFSDPAVKAGITYKIDGRRYFYLHAGLFSKAPFADNIFISPRTRDTRQEEVNHETIQNAEAGYIINSPLFRLRFSGYITVFRQGLNVLSFYHDEYQTFVNYAISSINKKHVGIELGAEVRLNKKWTAGLAAAIGRYYYTSRPQVTVSLDNDAYIVSREPLYTQYFRIPGTPQEVYGLEFRYQSTGAFFATVTGSYTRSCWLEFNPIRRTYSSLEGVEPQSEQWNSIIKQLKLPDNFTIDISAGTSWQLKRAAKNGYARITTNVGINNCLNNQNISGGYEQLRFDTDKKDVDRYPPKFFYANGLNFFASITYRF
ncbi:TonB-dependent receptor [Sediminibacterium ginsengisoli]|uniref:TonB-dependent receptor n=1 Tax=Sediminibacterium ginsengisoli TaxID=413434 RepID=A0A1T4KMC3_9BACT|nr:TonB-dependent receptor [Sediminibacterium ginsengisoli]SJZ43592.1 hypothetical protein SAMN04488132_10210 [Sediminibacterium ginsengisoli]